MFPSCPSHLPTDVRTHFLGFLPPTEVFRARRVNTAWRAACGPASPSWDRLLRLHYPGAAGLSLTAETAMNQLTRRQQLCVAADVEYVVELSIPSQGAFPPLRHHPEHAVFPPEVHDPGATALLSALRANETWVPPGVFDAFDVVNLMDEPACRMFVYDRVRHETHVLRFHAARVYATGDVAFAMRFARSVDTTFTIFANAAEDGTVHLEYTVVRLDVDSSVGDEDFDDFLLEAVGVNDLKWTR